ncbi:hypothetical protein NDU88_001218 [Pleurodeles waltl]|uniref:Uncharacterized protein n=1 Tax=Pleurodeles waltl TaxID=8319 RepID=A0AAV7S9A3_PLEWA|nr:hypothetical protein NDU88_001218 [Pleurodeles waltl]
MVLSALCARHPLRSACLLRQKTHQPLTPPPTNTSRKAKRNAGARLRDSPARPLPESQAAGAARSTQRVLAGCRHCVQVARAGTS